MIQESMADLIFTNVMLKNTFWDALLNRLLPIFNV